VPSAAAVKRLRALEKKGITMSEIASRYAQAQERPVSVNAVSRVIAGHSRSAPLEEFIEVHVLGAQRYSLWPNGD
jgi:hypothetical protein